jgi:hypothetical protein
MHFDGTPDRRKTTRKFRWLAIDETSSNTLEGGACRRYSGILTIFFLSLKMVSSSPRSTLTLLNDRCLG